MTAIPGSFGANGLTTSVLGNIPEIPSVRTVAASLASNSAKRVHMPSYTREMKRRETPKGLNIPRTAVTYSG